MPVITEIGGHDKDLGGGLVIRRLLPALARQSIGPFVFFDHFGPLQVTPAMDLDVRPHPHIGRATVTYLYDGAFMHRDSLGYEQCIEPGAINWMTAGRGIVHSERRPADLVGRSYLLHGLQLWAALPLALEDTAPAFSHTPADDLPQIGGDGYTGRVLVGSAFGLQSPVQVASPTLYLDLALAAGASLNLPPLAGEIAIYPIDADVSVDGRGVPQRVLAILDAEQPARIDATRATRLIVIGGDPLDGPRHLWWNFVSSRKQRLLEAADSWAAGRMTSVADDNTFIPLPKHRPPA
ncbi:MAG: pirin family protein [Pseudomonadota bacterium]